MNSKLAVRNKLRRGWTTGAYAMATTGAAFKALVTKQKQSLIQIFLPKGQNPTISLCRLEIGNNWARAGAIKDAGDDPDITHGCEIISEVRFGKKESGIVFKAGEGVGTVTLPGLPLNVGEPAINPKPREMITQFILKLAKHLSAPTDIIITISIPGGIKLAKKTMNSRLGIIGGLSILGTTGIVIPYSCASWINSIHRGIDVARSANLTHIVASTGSTSETAVKQLLPLPEQALIDMGDFVGGMLKYLRKKPIPYLTIAGGFGKLTKLAQGNLDLHSSRSQINMNKLADLISEIGGSGALFKAVKKANTGLHVFEMCENEDIEISTQIARTAKEVVLASLGASIKVDILIFNRKGKLVGKSDKRL